MSSPLKKDSTLQVTEQEGVVLSNVRRGGGFKQVSLCIAGHRVRGLSLSDKKDRLRRLYIAGYTEEDWSSPLKWPCRVTGRSALLRFHTSRDSPLQSQLIVSNMVSISHDGSFSYR